MELLRATTDSVRRSCEVSRPPPQCCQAAQDPLCFQFQWRWECWQGAMALAMLPVTLLSLRKCLLPLSAEGKLEGRHTDRQTDKPQTDQFSSWNSSHFFTGSHSSLRCFAAQTQQSGLLQTQTCRKKNVGLTGGQCESWNGVCVDSICKLCGIVCPRGNLESDQVEANRKRRIYSFIFFFFRKNNIYAGSAYPWNAWQLSKTPIFQCVCTSVTRAGTFTVVDNDFSLSASLSLEFFSQLSLSIRCPAFRSYKKFLDPV